MLSNMFSFTINAFYPIFYCMLTLIIKLTSFTQYFTKFKDLSFARSQFMDETQDVVKSRDI